MTALKELPTISFDRWKLAIRTAMDIDQVMLVTSAYLSMWDSEELARLPAEISAPRIDGSADLLSRAVIATRAELHFAGDERAHQLLHNMSLTLAAAATRLKYLQALRARA